MAAWGYICSTVHCTCMVIQFRGPICRKIICVFLGTLEHYKGKINTCRTILSNKVNQTISLCVKAGLSRPELVVNQKSSLLSFYHGLDKPFAHPHTRRWVFSNSSLIWNRLTCVHNFFCECFMGKTIYIFLQDECGTFWIQASWELASSWSETADWELNLETSISLLWKVAWLQKTIIMQKKS